MDKGYKNTAVNKRRAGYCAEALELFAKRVEAVLEIEKGETVGDLIADLLHYSAAKGWNAENIARMGLENFRHEATGRAD